MVTIIASDLVYLSYELENYTKNVNKAMICGDIKGTRLKVDNVQVINNCSSLSFEGIAEKVAEKISNSKDNCVVLITSNSVRFSIAMLYPFSTISRRVRFVIYDQERVEVDGEVFKKVEIDHKTLVVLMEMMNGRYKVEEIERITGISKATVSRIRRKLEEMGLVKKVDIGKYCVTERGKIVVFGGGIFRNVKKNGRYYDSQILYT
ncbi:transcriptional regulator, TrmB [Sulfolobus islandicus M.14.25]|uniref:Transcriptional regulator, TrmB n=1 Tax=Saccharolobus islandicus (strain M.14.25 / Kamchatka \|nr:ArsR family transcriptional regulator [Sulfolobus islandicus]ACP37679.1 transcriptional regulator, TrmB [Sulfolobus islandicus M.14.25]